MLIIGLLIGMALGLCLFPVLSYLLMTGRLGTTAKEIHKEIAIMGYEEIVKDEED